MLPYRVVETVELLGRQVSTSASSGDVFPIWTKVTKRFSQTALDINQTQLNTAEILHLNLDQASGDIRTRPRVDVLPNKSLSLPSLVAIPKELFESLNCSNCSHRVQMNIYANGKFFQDSNRDKIVNQTVSLDSWVVGVKVDDHLGIQSSSNTAIIQLSFRVLTDPGERVSPL